ncbi:hypothetical protein [Nitrobacter sp. JJSN]|uniref:hypothetical protein n=1 Tax=Nitrobacter sp. JJSN TaxID=3453033 RepID=UPI003F7581C0
MTIFEFFDNKLTVSSGRDAKALTYRELPSHLSDAFDDFEIEYDEISDASDTELKQYFQRLQNGLPLSSSEKLNSVHSSLRNFCRELAKHEFFVSKVNFSNKRYAHFDVASKVVTIEVEGIETGLRFDDIKEVFENQTTFSAQSAVGKRLRQTFVYLDRSFSTKGLELRNRTFVQSIASLASVIVRSGNFVGTEQKFRNFIAAFAKELSRQVEMGLDATDGDYIQFQRSVNANVKGAAKTRQTILLRKMLQFDPSFLDILGPSVVAASGLTQEAKRLAEMIGSLVESLNEHFSASAGTDLIKPTNKTMGALRSLAKPVKNYSDYKEFISNLYFVFWEGTGNRLKGKIPTSFNDINTLRTDLQHDLDHGKQKKVAAKRKRSSTTFKKYASSSTPRTAAPENFPMLQVGILNQIEKDLHSLIS